MLTHMLLSVPARVPKRVSLPNLSPILKKKSSSSDPLAELKTEVSILKADLKQAENQIKRLKELMHAQHKVIVNNVE